MDSDLIFVVYMGGCCGDFVAAAIDNRDCELNRVQNRMRLPEHRERLKKIHLFDNDDERDQYVAVMSEQYRSIPSHDLDYHLRRHHRFIAVTVTDVDTAQWAAHRFQHSHRPEIWRKFCQQFGVKTLDNYAELVLNYSKMIRTKTPDIIALEDILSGHALTRLDSILGSDLNTTQQEFYQQWLSLAHQS
jgi:hypothetical protein